MFDTAKIWRNPDHEFKTIITAQFSDKRHIFLCVIEQCLKFFASDNFPPIHGIKFVLIIYVSKLHWAFFLN